MSNPTKSARAASSKASARQMSFQSEEKYMENHDQTEPAAGRGKQQDHEVRLY